MADKVEEQANGTGKRKIAIEWNAVTAITAVFTSFILTFAYWDNVGRGLTSFAESSVAQSAPLLLVSLLVAVIAAGCVYMLVVKLNKQRKKRRNRRVALMTLLVTVRAMLTMDGARSQRAYKTAMAEQLKALADAAPDLVETVELELSRLTRLVPIKEEDIPF